MLEQIYEEAKSWVLEAGELVKQSLDKQVNIEFKTSAADLVTEMDRGIEQFFIKKINEKFPNHYVLGEEGVSRNNTYNPMQETVWIIDPIDGTTNFVHLKRNFAISVGIYVNGSPEIGFVYDPVGDELFSAQKGKGAFLNHKKLEPLSETPLEYAMIAFNPIWLVPNEKCDFQKLQAIVKKARGIRCIGSASLEMAYVACGRIDAHLDFRLSSWDIAGGMVLLEELGAKLTTVNGDKIDVFHPGSTLFSKPGLSETLIKELL